MTSSPGAAALRHVRTVRAGTRNGPKLEAVRCALAAYVDGVEVVGHEVGSGVPEQPVGYGEIVAGARQRARAAFAQGPCELSVGIEDGLVVLDDLDGDVLNVGAAVVSDGQRESLGLSSGFAYPPSCSATALAGREPIGGLFDTLWRRCRPDRDREPSALSVGNVGKLSHGVLTRAEYGRHAVLCALIRFLNPDLYFATSIGVAEVPAGDPVLPGPTRKSP